ncbi:hypothetical protein PPEP_a2052 [Pseudoalteromonas peptidolytica F12-50-A1]|uniref:Uncharacterized protein n=1 Tax=Pseudoalteromonas peptidolytica F12-50-A1 TaxID=1315280 RepID=A0A8I0MX36_9GAMM|nr:hypothetical protein [Pseudoalteromonas peptidolytica F12-50-A1]
MFSTTLYRAGDTESDIIMPKGRVFYMTYLVKPSIDFNFQNVDQYSAF